MSAKVQPERPWMRPHHILTASDVRRLCNISHGDRHTMIRWRRDRGFPEPVKVIRMKRGARIELWDRRDVVAWLAANPPLSHEL